MVIIMFVSPQTSAYFKGTKFSWHGNFPWQIQGRKKTRFYCPGHVNFDLGQVKIEVWWPVGQLKLASVVLSVCLKVSAWYM